MLIWAKKFEKSAGEQYLFQKIVANNLRQEKSAMGDRTDVGKLKNNFLPNIFM